MINFTSYHTRVEEYIEQNPGIKKIEALEIILKQDAVEEIMDRELGTIPAL